MLEKLAKLLEVKSIVTLLFSVVFCILALIQAIKPDQFMTIFGIVITYYFTRKQSQ